VPRRTQATPRRLSASSRSPSMVRPARRGNRSATHHALAPRPKSLETPCNHAERQILQAADSSRVGQPADSCQRVGTSNGSSRLALTSNAANSQFITVVLRARPACCPRVTRAGVYAGSQPSPTEAARVCEADVSYRRGEPSYGLDEGEGTAGAHGG